MTTFKYSAISKSGERVSGVIEGFNEMDAVDRIRQTCDIVLKVSEVKESPLDILNMEIGGKKLNSKAFLLICSEFSTILKAGIPITRAVNLIAEKTTDKTLKDILLRVAEDVEGGRTLSDSFEERGGDLLPITFVETVRAGEESGSLDRSFESMYRHFEKQSKMRSKVRSAMAYPVFVLALAIIVVVILMVRVVPTFVVMFEQLGSELPLITRILISVSNFFSASWMWVLGIAAMLLIALKIYGITEDGRMNLAKAALKLPVVGNIVTLSAASQFANTMTVMLQSGIPITRAVTITSRIMDNYYVSSEVGKITGKLEEGHGLAESMAESGCLPDILVDMTAVGEETGELTETLDHTAAFYDGELDTAVAAAVDSISPILLILIGGVAGFIVLAVFLAMYSMYGAML